MTGNFYMNAAAKQIYGEQRMSNRQRGAINHRGVCVCLSVIPLNASKSPGTTVKSAGKMTERSQSCGNTWNFHLIGWFVVPFQRHKL